MPFSLFEVPIDPSKEIQTESSKRLSILGRKKNKTFHESNNFINFISFIFHLNLTRKKLKVFLFLNNSVENFDLSKNLKNVECDLIRLPDFSVSKTLFRSLSCSQKKKKWQEIEEPIKSKVP